MKTRIKIILGAIFIACLVPNIELKAQVGKSAYGQVLTIKTGAKGEYIKKGFKGIVDISCYPFVLDLSVGYQFNPYLYLGGFLGTGYPTVFVCGVDFRSYFTKTKVAPFVGLQTGLGVAPDITGFYFGVGPGVRFGLSKKIGLSLQPVVKLISDKYVLLALNIALDF